MKTLVYHFTPTLRALDTRSVRQRKTDRTVFDIDTWKTIVDGLRAVGMADNDIEARIRFATTGSLSGPLPQEVIDAHEDIFRVREQARAVDIRQLHPV